METTLIPDNYFQYWNVGIIRWYSTIDTHVGREGQKDLADSYEENVVKGLVIAARIVCIRGSSHEKKRLLLNVQVDTTHKRNIALQTMK